MDWTTFSEIYHVYPSGIYGVVNMSRDRVYIGATHTDFADRWSAHRTTLERGTHRIHRLQRDWLLDGPHAFAFLIFQELHHSHPRMDWYEQFWLDGFRERGLMCYNSPGLVRDTASARSWLPKQGKCVVLSPAIHGL